MKKRYKGKLFGGSPLLFILDCDGVLTDGMIPRRFNIYDGAGLTMLMQKGIKVVIVSGANSNDIQVRADELKLTGCFLGIKNKEIIVKQLIESNRIYPYEVIYMGDDLNDLNAFEEVGIKIAPRNATKEVKKHANYITNKKGGEGAIREVCDLWLKKL